MNKFSSKISYIIITMFMGAIIVSFALTGFQDFNTNTNAVADVDGTPITIREYQRALDAQTKRFSQMFGGKSLSSQQIKQFRIKENVINNLVQQKLMLNFANDLELNASQSEIKNSIKTSEFFKTGGKFDVTKYKNLLNANGYSPSKYELLVADDMKRIKLDKLLGSFAPSKSFVKEILEMKSNTADVVSISFQKEAMTKNIEVSVNKINAFIADKKNEATLAALFKTEEAKYKKKKLTLKSKTVKKELAKSHLQRTMRKELNEFNTKLSKQLAELMNSGNISSLKRIAKKYDLQLQESASINLFDLKLNSIDLERSSFDKIFKNQDVKTVTKKETPIMAYFVKAKNFKVLPMDAKSSDAETKRLQTLERNSMFSGLMETLQKNSKVVTYPNIL